ncbi:MAG: GNAT family N-acetyltransferase [Oscillospiraceae bacterium]|jgi:predicted N-acetyltransferase YhbS|nr:GNAT family N-acetyltransferase [Oscillospiraceae bacterium]
MPQSNITVRAERAEERHAVENIDREAFRYQSERVGEHLLTHKLRQSPDFIPELNFVAELDGKLAGHIIYSKSTITATDGGVTDIISFGPLAVLPELQNRGVGKALLLHSFNAARELGYRAVVILGEPDYYPRVGFRRAADFGLTTTMGTFDAFMAYPLYDGALDGVAGVVYESEVFDTLTDAEVEEFDQAFLPQEPVVLTTIDVVLEKLSPPARAALRQKDIPTLAKLREFSGREVLQWGEFSEQDRAAIDSVMSAYGFGKKTWEQ